MAFETFKIYKSKALSMDAAVKELASMGYVHVPKIAEEGDFSRKGDVLDIYCVSFDYPVRIEWDWQTVARIRSFDPETGLFLTEHQILFVLPRLKTKRKQFLYQEEPLEASLDLKAGDLVVHIQHGIGKYLGRRKVQTKKDKKDCLAIEYRNRERLFVPVEKAHLIQRYVNLGKRRPNLSRLGTKEWNSVKQKAARSIRQYALELVREQAAREITGGFCFSPDVPWQKEFEDSFIYQQTSDQITALAEVKQDMQANKAMDRLICGDVGYGKTEVAMRAAFKAIMDSKQVAFLVPTTILAEQHYYNFKSRLEKFPVNIGMLSRFRTPSEQKEIIKGLKKGSIDLVIGTHRLLSQDVDFKDLGLFIVDDEQRFGVKQKERIRRLRLGVDVLTLTATPIPRTLYMGLTGIKSVSVIKTPPKERLAVKTYIEEFKPRRIAGIIKREIARRGQVFFIENRIKNLDYIQTVLGKYLDPSIKIAVVHGRMRPGCLEKTLIDFMNKRIDCLICTAIIESGIDIPRANTLIVNNAHMFGLSDLHQLRGRVGRFNIQAYAYFILPVGVNLSSQARSRIETVKKYSYLGSGFDVAMKDLEIRGAGNILGEQQHGYVWQIGLDLYCRLLRIEIDNLKDKYNIHLS
jgi:transcription-repair coupling factor (superfamily II helicase)